MIRALFHRYVPASLYGGQTAFAALARIDGELRHCDRLDAAVAAVDDLKNDLCARLQARFDQPPAQALALKAANLLLARRHFQRRSAVLRSRPFGLVIDPSNMCRLACPGCVHSERSESLQLFDWPSGTLSESRLAALLALYGPHAVAAYFCNYGEPLLNLNTPKLIRMAKRYLLTTMLSTSLSVQRFDADDYVRSGLDYMVLSIDGATQPVYQRFRRNGSLETVLGNIRSLLKARRALRKRTPVLSWNFLAFEHNAHEIPAAARMARDLGVDHFRVVEPFDVTWDDPEIRPAAVDAGVRRLSWSSVGIQPGNWNPFPETVDSASIARASTARGPKNPRTASRRPPDIRATGCTRTW